MLAYGAINVPLPMRVSKMHQVEPLDDDVKKTLREIVESAGKASATA